MQYLEQLRQVIGLRSYGQKDPLVEFKKESFALFENLLQKLKYDVTLFLNNISVIESHTEKKSEEKKIVVEELKEHKPKCLLILRYFPVSCKLGLPFKCFRIKN